MRQILRVVSRVFCRVFDSFCRGYESPSQHFQSDGCPIHLTVLMSCGNCSTQHFESIFIVLVTSTSIKQHRSLDILHDKNNSSKCVNFCEVQVEVWGRVGATNRLNLINVTYSRTTISSLRPQKLCEISVIYLTSSPFSVLRPRSTTAMAVIIIILNVNKVLSHIYKFK